MIDNQSPLHITKIWNTCQVAITPVAEWCHRLLGDANVVDSAPGDSVLLRQKVVSVITIFWTKQDICIAQKYVCGEVYT